jgi:RNA polymerase-binding protein DksA
MARADRQSTTRTILAAAKKLGAKLPSGSGEGAAPEAKKADSGSGPTKKAAAKKSGTSQGLPGKKAAKRTPAQRVAAKKAAQARRLVVQEGETSWTRKELNAVLRELNENHERLTRQLESQEAELAGLMRDAGDGAGQDQADMGATSFGRDHELTVVNNEREMLAQIDRAKARIEDGTYGICESCGGPIGKMRVMAFPRATLCMTCKQREERR